MPNALSLDEGLATLANDFQNVYRSKNFGQGQIVCTIENPYGLTVSPKSIR
jgi:hypothetical protein